MVLSAEYPRAQGRGRRKHSAPERTRPYKTYQSVTKDTFYEQLYCSAGGCPCETQGHSSRPTCCLTGEIFFSAEKRNKPEHFYSHLLQNWSNINNVSADWICRARKVLTWKDIHEFYGNNLQKVTD